ncbi:hypothetical protein [Nakamurella endophytica]|uniref:hypothetical protein n=1 Tax=Nakamurella endophytica TaxID=1748367 RepID=UPI00166D9C10|nr:hypothetical protein [Nakamurella endophytica]
MSIYSRADAIADGLLIETPRQLWAEFRIPGPAAVTAQLWAETVATATYPQPPAPDAPPVLPFEVRARLEALLWQARTVYETDPRRRHRQTFVAWRIPGPLADASTPGRVHPDEHPDARPVRVAFTIGPGDCGETVATLAHAHTGGVGRFHLADDDPAVTWPAAGWEPDSATGDARPLVTIEVLQAMLDHAAADPTRPPEVEAQWWRDGTVTIDAGGRCITLRPDPTGDAGIYPLGPLGWPLRRTAG